jgi:anti-sigma factor RsiW
MGCWTTKRRLSAYIDGELPPARRERVARHLAGCPGCAARERELRDVWAELEALPPPAGAPELWSGVLERLALPARTGARWSPATVTPRWLAPATVAACALAGLVGGAFFALRFDRPAGTRRSASAATPATDTFAEAFGDGWIEPLTTASGGFLPTAGRRANEAGSREDAR